MQVLNVNYSSPDAPSLFCKSLKETGFAVLTQHPLSAELINSAYSQWQDFFYSTLEIKNTYQFEKSSQDGYFPMRSENAKNNKITDLKEFFHVYPWGKIPDQMRHISLEMYNSLQGLAAELLQWIEEHLPEKISQQLSMPLRNMITESPNTLLRVLHYPPLTQKIDDGAVRAAPHEDINLITLLPAATAPGLEVLDTQGKWHSVSCDPCSIVVNVGDMLQMCSQGYYKSTTHRVVNPADDQKHQSRFSMPLFLHPRKEVKLSENVTAVEYLHERLRQIGIY